MRGEFMKARGLVFGAAAIACALSASAAQAAILLDDPNFNNANGGVPQLGETPGNTGGPYFTDFYVSNGPQGGSVDLIGVGTPFNFYPSVQALYVDICGSTGTCGVFTTDQDFGPGAYTITLGLGGNARVAVNDITTVTFGGTTRDFTLTPNETEVVTFTQTLTSSSPLLPLSIGDEDLTNNGNIGNTLLSVEVASAPEPATWAMLLVGFGMLGFMMRGMRRREVRAIA
jgi:hypothetical protein